MSIIERLTSIASTWKYANRDVYDVCRDAIEEIRVLKTENDGLKKQIAIYEESSKPKLILNDKNNSYMVGWGKGKDE